MPHLMRTLIAAPLRLQESKFRVIAPDVGGGFGLKCHLYSEDLVIPAVSRLVGRPVKWIEDRYEALSASTHAREVTIDIKIAVDEDGTIKAIDQRALGNAGAYSANPYTPVVDVHMAGVVLPGMYNVRNARFQADAALTNKCPAGAYRGTGMVVGVTARELLIEDIARALGRDPIDLRIQNAIPSEPYTTVFGQHYDGGSYAESLVKVRNLIGYEKVREEQARLRTAGRCIGVGFSTNVEPTGWGTDMCRAQRWGAPDFAYPLDSASVEIEPDGSVRVTTGLHSQGQGLETSLAQVAADELGVRFDDVTVVMGDTATSAFGAGTYASRSAVTGTGSIMRAARDVRRRLQELAAEALEASPEDIEISDSRAYVAGSPARAITLPDLAWLAYYGVGRRPAEMDEPLPAATRSYEPPETHSNGVMGAVVEVDIETGEIELKQVAVVEDCGIMLNPMIVDGQIAGGVAQGIGGALYEEMRYTDEGGLMSGSLIDFLYPSAQEIPAMAIDHIETPSTVTAGGVKGMGEAGLIISPGAVLNAVADALAPFGVKITRAPLTPAHVLEMIRGKDQVDTSD